MSQAPARVVFVINDLRRAGTETQLVRLATGLDRSRYEPSVVILKSQSDFDAELASANVPLARLRRSSPKDALVLWRLFRHLASARPQIVHSFLPLANLLTALAGRWARVPVVIVSQRASYEATESPPRRTLARWSHRRATHVIVNSAAALREELAAGFPPQRISYVPNGVDVPASSPPLRRTDLGLSDGPLVVSVGQLAPEKGHADLIAAWPSVRQACPDARLALVGDGRLRPQLEAQARALGAGDSIVLLGFRHPAAPYLAAADVVVSPSRTEGMPNAVLEAMAFGKPVVATSVGGVPELIEHGVTGWLVPPRDPAALARGLAVVLADAALRQSLAAAARGRVERQFSTERMLAATQAVYARWL